MHEFDETNAASVKEIEALTALDLINAELFNEDFNSGIITVCRLKRKDSEESGLVILVIKSNPNGSGLLVRPLATLEPLPSEIFLEDRYEQPSKEFIEFICKQASNEADQKNDYAKNVNRG